MWGKRGGCSHSVLCGTDCVKYISPAGASPLLSFFLPPDLSVRPLVSSLAVSLAAATVQLAKIILALDPAPHFGSVRFVRVGHVVFDDHLVVDGIVGRGGLGIRRGAPAPAAATPAALWALGAAVGGFEDSWVSGCGL